MNIAGIILLGAGYLLGNPKARDTFFAKVQKLAGAGVDALNNLGGTPDAPVSKPEE